MSKKGLPESVRMKHDLHYVEELFHDRSGAVGRYIPIEVIHPNPNQPRQEIGDLTDLKASIREKGVLEPILVRRKGEEFEIIAGERRWRASREIGLTVIPCIEKEVDEKEMMEIALIENLQRKDLDPFEEAEGLQVLIDKYQYTHAKIAEVIGKSRSSVTETLSLSVIPADIRTICREADISSKSLLLQVVRQPDLDSMKHLVEQIRDNKWTRRDIRKSKKRKEGKAAPHVFLFKGKEFKLSINFKESDVTHDQIREVLMEVLNSLQS